MQKKTFEGKRDRYWGKGVGERTVFGFEVFKKGKVINN